MLASLQPLTFERLMALSPTLANSRAKAMYLAPSAKYKEGDIVQHSHQERQSGQRPSY